MDTFGIIVGIALILAFLWAFWIIFVRWILVTTLAENDFLFTFRKEGHIKYLMQGETLLKYIYKLAGHYIDTYGYITRIGYVFNQKTGKEEESPGAGTKKPYTTFAERWFGHTWSELIFGAYWIGFPPRRLLEYSLTYARPWRPEDESKKTDKHYQVDTEHEIVRRSTTSTFLPWRHVYSIYVKDVEVEGFSGELETLDKDGKPQTKNIEGQAQIDVWGTFTLVCKNALLPIIILRGDYFPHVSDAISGAIADFVNELTLDVIRGLDKVSNQTKDGEIIKDANGQPLPSKFEKAVLDVSFGPSGTINTTGFEIVAFNTRGIEVESEAEEALRAVGLAEANAQARAAEGDGEGRYHANLGKGRGTGYAAEVAAFKNPTLAAQVIAARDIARERSEGLKKAPHIRTYVEGGATSPVMVIPDTDSSPTPPAPSTDQNKSKDPKEKQGDPPSDSSQKPE